jgi:transcriptional regulator with XRE-family HTH domain
MSDTTTGSTVPRRQLGRHLRELRNQQRLTVKAAAESLEWSETKIWRIETGQSSLRSLDVEAMCRVYDASPELTEALKGLAKETKAKGWWASYGEVVPPGFNLYIGLEQAASEICDYEPDLVPGLFQTQEYADTVIRHHCRDLDEEEIDRRVRMRLERQALLRRRTSPLKLRLVVAESVLRQPVGGHDVMLRQLDRISEMADLPAVSLRIMPFGVGMHDGLVTQSFSILRFPLNGGGMDSEPPTVYKDGFTGSLYLDKPHEVERFSEAFERIWETSLDGQASLRIIQQVAEELGQ